MHIIVHTHACIVHVHYSTCTFLLRSTGYSTFQCMIFPLVYDFVLFVVEYHPVSATPVDTVVSYMPPSNALLKSRLVKPTDCCSFFASRKEYMFSMEKVESV